MNARPEQGSALVLAMLLIVVLSALAHTAVVGARATADATLLERGRVEAQAAAEGGIALARLRLAENPSWPGTAVTIGRSRVELRVTAPDEVVATATCPVRGAGLPVRATVTATLARSGAALPTVVDWHEPGR